MPRSAVANHARREASRRRILDTALRLFSERGYAGTPVDAIVGAARISPGLLYHYFPSKLDLLRAVFQESMRDVQASFAAADAATDPADRLSTLLRAAVDIVRRRRDFWTLSYGVRMQREVMTKLGPDVFASTAAILAVLERYLREAGWPNPADEARLLFAQIDGLCQHYVLDPDGYPVDRLTDRLIDRYRTPRNTQKTRKGRKARNTRKARKR